MQTLFICSLFIYYSALLLQYKISYTRGASQLAKALLLQKTFAQLTNRNINGIAIIITCLFLYWLSSYSFRFLNWPKNEKTIIITTLVSLLCLCISSLAAAKEVKHDNIIPHSQLSFYIITRVFFLIAYELFFRMQLFEVCLLHFSTASAIGINVMAYVLAHVFSSRKDLIGSLPFGVILCSITWYAQSVYPAVIIHLCMALPYEIIVLNKNAKATENYIHIREITRQL